MQTIQIIVLIVLKLKLIDFIPLYTLEFQLINQWKIELNERMKKNENLFFQLSIPNQVLLFDILINLFFVFILNIIVIVI